MKKSNLFFAIALCAMFFLLYLLQVLPFGKDLGWASCSAQNVGINTTGTLPNASAKSATYSGEVPFTLEDRDRIIKMDERLESQQRQLDDLKTQLDDLKTLFYWGFGILFSLMLFLLGFIIWDRRTAMEPVRERTQSLILTLREYAKEQPKLADILRSYGLM